MRNCRILVADDDPVLRETLVEILRIEGYDVESAADGALALASITRARPAVVLLDMRMPVLDGWELARRMAAHGLDVPIVVMTAAVDPSEAAEQIEAEGWVEKPFKLDELLPTIRRLCARRAPSEFGYRNDCSARHDGRILAVVSKVKSRGGYGANEVGRSRMAGLIKTTLTPRAYV
jgi:CheY-like chemotaxis protein